MSTSLLDSSAVRLVPDFLPDSLAIFEQFVASITWDTRMRARKAASFGVPYNYSGIEWPAAPFPEPIVPILDRVASAVGLIPNNCLAHFYPDGASTMGFHSDATDELEPGTGIAIVSLGTERDITFRAIADKSRLETYRLTSGSLLYMTPEMQADWKHAILADGSTGGRVSLTFRLMKG